jgi:hypothetical protein
MKGSVLKLPSHVSACVVKGFGAHHQNLGSQWNKVCNNPTAFGRLGRLLKQFHKKVANNLSFGSTHIIEPQDPKYLQQLSYSPNLQTWHMTFKCQ